MELRQLALQVFLLPDPEQKVQQLAQTAPHVAHWALDTQAPFSPASDAPGRPEHPGLIAPDQVPKRSPHTLAGRAALMHAICHIEFNAIALALDAVWRFPNMPDAYYRDWMRVACEEATHFDMVQQHLHSMGYAYGDFDAHDGLWQMCEQTRHDITARMALVPRTLEARGLDATPIIQKKLRSLHAPDALHSVAILDVILRDEIGHVAIGNHWYAWLCKQQGLDSLAHFKALQVQYRAPRPKPPLNLQARQLAGFTQPELDHLSNIGA
jgi:uncharacterized ferritin-like protein (DUF455 family)